jgi:hypothetical protein
MIGGRGGTMLGQGVKFAFLMEPGGGVSDMMSCQTSVTPGQAADRDYEFKFYSDANPDIANNPQQGELQITEKGKVEDLAPGLFQPVLDSGQTEVPFHVNVFSDLDVPEPSTLVLLLFAVTYWSLGRHRNIVHTK